MNTVKINPNENCSRQRSKEHQKEPPKGVEAGIPFMHRQIQK
jgi:hypothetical protein